MVSRNAMGVAWLLVLLNLFVMWLLIASIFMTTYFHEKDCRRYYQQAEILKCKRYASYKHIEIRDKDPVLMKMEFGIGEIYRLDVSCQVDIMLGYILSTHYRNKQKKCSLSSLITSVNSKLKESIPRNNTQEPYEPLLSNEINYDPFKSNVQLERHLFGSLKVGGIFTPQFTTKAPCNEESIDFVVFIVTFTRNRTDNLALFLINMHNYLQKAEYLFKYKIVVVEQLRTQTGMFNKGRLYNSAVKYIIDQQPLEEEIVDCIVLHDVDLIPSADSFMLGEYGDYRCRQMPWHLSQKVRHLNDYKDHVYLGFLSGGILSLRLEHFIDVNGFSNRFFNWGGEDVSFLNLNLTIFS
jgi:hypothetical protein